MAGPETPALRQYREAKEAHPDCVVLFRLGDFFEIFEEDAVLAAPILGVALTGRDFGKQGRTPMCGVPHHSLDLYARKLLEAGLKVAVCDQTDEARPGVRLIPRRVVRVLTAGTLIEDALLDPRRSRRCAATFPATDGVGVAVLDFSTGEGDLTLLGSGIDSAIARLAALDVAEVLVPESALINLRAVPGLVVTPRPEASFGAGEGWELLRAAGLELPDAHSGEWADAAVRALAALTEYGREAQLLPGPGFLRLGWSLPAETMELDAHTRRNLELVDPLVPGGTSLLQLVDRTRTAPGARRLRSWLLAPLTDLEALRLRQAAVATLTESATVRGRLAGLLGRCRDLERLVARCVHGVAGPRDLRQLADTLKVLPELAATAGDTRNPRLARLADHLRSAPSDLGPEISAQLVDDPPASAREGGCVRPGADAQLDAIAAESREAREYISSLEEVERRRTGIRSLKVGFNRVFGYYIEVRGPKREDLPADYLRRQTLAGAERYVTATLKDRELVVLSARERAVRREQEVLRQLVDQVAAQAAVLSAAAGAMAEVDALWSLAEAGSQLGWVLPEVDLSLRLELKAGRHPLVERALGPGRFVPNDARLDGENERIWLITGPNMAGKSTFLRQVAVICLLGQVGSLVPCSEARYGLVDRIFTRVGAQDDISGGRSTFMVEMTEVAEILRLATRRSLVVLDEVGRGTSTYDGLSLAQAILEHLHNDPTSPARVLFSTHYHELTALDRLPALHNYRAEVAESGSGPSAAVTFLHTVVPGGADRSYGLHVARLAGVPADVVTRAEGILFDHESQRPVANPASQGWQMALPLPPPDPMLEELRALEVDRMTPLEALLKLSEWQRRAGGEE